MRLVNHQEAACLIMLTALLLISLNSGGIWAKVS